MNRGSLMVIAALFVLLATSTVGAASGITARVDNTATVVIGNTATNFQFFLYNCPAGEEMAVISWEAEQPDRAPGNGVASGTQPFGPSTGEQVQQLTLTAGGNFLAGESWVGSGLVACGTTMIPVSGAGPTKAA